jgi:hypothetical protein
MPQHFDVIFVKNQSPRIITLQKITRPKQKSNLTILNQHKTIYQISHQNVEALHKTNQEINQNWNHIFA